MNITDDDIKRVEKIFFPNGGSFKDAKNERYNFIKCIDKSIHLQACPGSGKTTALLAKIYLLSEKMPFENNKGICVLTHTNIAIDIIKKQLGNKADKLFTHPNFFGTIQSFVDRFLAIPAYLSFFHYKPYYIDTNLQRRRMETTYNLPNIDQNIFNKLRSYHYAYDLFGNYTIHQNTIINSVTRKEITFKKPNSLNDWSNKEKEQIKQAAIKLKLKIWKEDKILSFEDAYNFANCYLCKYPILKNYFSSRFKYVFIDEAQDTSEIQKKIIGKCFNENVVIQWIGDVNQSIMNYNEEQSCWNPEDNRYDVLCLTDSKRVSQPIADVIKNVAVKPYNTLIGNNNVCLKPVIILFDDNTKDKVIEEFAKLVINLTAKFNNEQKSLYEISQLTGNPIKAVGWVGKPKNNGLSIQSYFPDFYKKSSTRKKVYFPNFYNMLHLSKNESLKTFTERFYNCVVEALYLSDVKDKNNKRYSRTSFIDYIKAIDEKILIKFQFKVYQCYRILQKFKLSDEFFNKISSMLVNCIINTLKLNLNDYGKSYLGKAELKDFSKDQVDSNNTFRTQVDGKSISIDIDTVHGVKGETHTATLYLDTKYRDNSIKYFIDELIGNPIQNNSKIKPYGLKIAHVAFSRPTHLLCIAIEKKTASSKEFDANTFEKIDLTENNSNT
ncbi:UvrD-helicase domain-containing protein [Ignavibacterium sp.]|uniref:UvrD-helicase domain-containing protein n=1 Tax=Ignavibacterium sp. TaxID=2651167 RepID=UPI0022056259|nr:UvrD-helicase domain-containing protein [Ignavibacterium sp.]BDQ02286.1 MAG: DNA helicase [Ignavibacterium sp.]